ncbi:MAG: phosphotransferase [Asgard group archaeon]|nr:phosphotransferase [Asgard group archaeon]
MIFGNPEDMNTQLLEKICSLYDIVLTDLNFLGAMDNNFVFEYQKNNKKYILRGGTRHTSEQVQAELDWILYLDSSGVKVSIPIKSKKKNYLELIKYKEKIINAMVFEKAPGIAVDYRNPEVWNEDLWEEMGRTLGKMHSAAVKYNSKRLDIKRLTAFESVQAQIDNCLDFIESTVIKRFNELKDKLSQLPRDNNAFGLIQYDFHADNFNIDNGKIIVYDFDDSYYFFFMYDLAASIHEAVWDVPDEKKREFANRFIPSLWKGYCEEYNLDRKWLDYLPDFLKWREFDIYATLVETDKEKTASERVLQELEEWIPEFKDRVESDKQIIPIPKDLKEWFRDIF